MTCPRCDGQLRLEAFFGGKTDVVCLQCGYREVDEPVMTSATLRVLLLGRRESAGRPNRTRGIYGGKRGTCGRCSKGFNSFQHRLCRMDPVPA